MSHPNDEMSKRLGEPFPTTAHKQRSIQGRPFTYVEGHTVIHRLNDATHNTWSMEIKSITTIDLKEDWKQVTAHVALTIPGLGTREHIGIQDVHTKGADLVKGAVTDALKKCATLFGVGLELYGPDYEAGETAQPARPAPPAERTRTQRQPQPAPAPRREPESKPQGPPVTPEKLKRLHAMARDLGLADPQWKPTVYKDYGVQHVNELSVEQADAVIARFAKKLQQRPLIDAAAGPPGEPSNDQWTR
jgi:hypothetical protein